jgi:hypothetical protein
LKGAGISLAKAAGISLAFVLAFAMAFAACDNGTSSGKGTTPVSPDGPTDMGTGPTATTWADVEGYLTAGEAGAPGYDVIYIRGLMKVTEGPSPREHHVTRIPSGKTLVITGEVEGVAPSNSVSTLTGAPRLIIPNRAELVVEAGGKLVLGGPKAELYAGIVDIQEGGALRVEEGAILSINRSSRLSVNGENPDSKDYSDDYIALNLESRSILALLGNFIDGDNIIAKTSAERRLIDISTSTAPIAIGAVEVYNSIPTGGDREESGTLKGAFNDGKEKATADSPIKVADTATEILTRLVGEPKALNPLKRLIYSGKGEIEGQSLTTTLTLPSSASSTIRLIVERDVEQDRDLTIAGGTLEIAKGASITVTKDGNNGKTLSLAAAASPVTAGALVVRNGARIAVADGCALDLSAANTGYAVLYGTVEVAAGGTINLPDDYDDPAGYDINWGTKDTGIGQIILNAGSTALVDSATPPYIAPAALTNVPDYSWTTDAASTVTLSGDTLKLNGALTVTKATGAASLTKKAIVESGVLSGVLTVENTGGLALTSGAKLTVADGASVVVKTTLDLKALKANVPATAGDKGAVTLAGNIIVEKGGTIALPQPIQADTNKDKIAEINYETGVIQLKVGSTATRVNGSDASTDDKYVGTTDGDSDAWEWKDNDEKSYVELKKDGEFALITGDITSAKSNNIINKLTVNSGATLTVKDGTTLTLKKPYGTLALSGTIELEKHDTTTGGTLDLSELNGVGDASGVLAAINGTINVRKNAVLTYPARENKHWAYVGTGKAVIYKDGKHDFKDAAGKSEKIVDTSGSLFVFDGASLATEYIEFGLNRTNIGGTVTMGSDTHDAVDKPGNKIPQSDTWTITKTGTLTIAASTNLSVGGTLKVANSGNLAFANNNSTPATASVLTLEGNEGGVSGTLILGDGIAGENTVIKAHDQKANHGADAKITINSTGDAAKLELVIGLLTPQYNTPGVSEAAAPGKDATIKTGTALVAGVTTTTDIKSGDDVVATLATSTAPVPAAGGFGAGVSITSSTKVIAVGAKGATL